MERYNVKNHLFYDGYELDNGLLSDPNYVSNLLNWINVDVFDNKGVITLVPYFSGKVKRDGGVSGIILGDNFHFTCHTFCYKNTVFVDYYGDESKKQIVEDILHHYFETTNYDMGSKDVHGNFGKHIILNVKPITCDKAVNLVKKILHDIEMTPIIDIIVNDKDKDHFDVIQLIAESHISFHRNGNEMMIDVFSCKYFDVDKVLEILNSKEEYIEVNRGIKYVN